MGARLRSLLDSARPSSFHPTAFHATTPTDRKEETRFLNKIEAQKGLEKGSSIGLIEDEREPAPGVITDPGFTQAQLMKVSQAESVIEERDQEIRKVGVGWGGVRMFDRVCVYAPFPVRVFMFVLLVGHLQVWMQQHTVPLAACLPACPTPQAPIAALHLAYMT